MIAELIATDADRASGLRVLFEVRGGGEGRLANLRAALLGSLPEAEGPLGELEEAGRALDAKGCPFELVAATAGNFEYYTGITFRAFAGAAECLRGGRYDRLADTIGGRAAAASGGARTQAR